MPDVGTDFLFGVPRPVVFSYSWRGLIMYEYLRLGIPGAIRKTEYIWTSDYQKIVLR